MYLRSRYHQANVLRKLAASTALLGQRILGGFELGSRTEGGKEELDRELYRVRRGTEGRTLGRLSPTSRRLDGRLMASINRSLKGGGSDGVQCRRALPAQRGRKEEGADKRALRCSERERGRESADRWALLRSERGKGEARGLSARGGLRH